MTQNSSLAGNGGSSGQGGGMGGVDLLGSVGVKGGGDGGEGIAHGEIRGSFRFTEEALKVGDGGGAEAATNFNGKGCEVLVGVAAAFEALGLGGGVSRFVRRL